MAGQMEMSQTPKAQVLVKDDSPDVPSCNEKKPVEKKFQESWSSQYPRLITLDDGSMAFKFCRRVTLPVPWLWVCATSELPTLQRHVKALDDQRAAADSTNCKFFKQQYESVIDKKTDSVELAICNVFYMAKEDLSLAKYESLIEFR